MASQTKLNLSNTKFEQTSGSTLNLGGNLIANSFSATTFSLVSVPQVGTSGNTILTRGSDGSIRQISQNLFLKKVDTDSTTAENIVRAQDINLISTQGSISISPGNDENVSINGELRTNAEVVNNSIVEYNGAVSINDTIKYTAGQIPSGSTDLVSFGFANSIFIPRLLEKKEIPDSTYTLLESDSSKLLIFLNECDVTLPNSIPEDLQFTAANYSSTGATTFNAEGTLNSSDGNVLEGQYSHAYFYKRNATTYVGILPGEGGGGSSGSTTSYSFQNGLTETGDIVRLGGNITGNTNITLNTGSGIQFNSAANFTFLGVFSGANPFVGLISGSNTTDQNFNYGDFIINIRNKVIFEDSRGLSEFAGGSSSSLAGSKTGIQYVSFGEANEDGDNANYSGLTGISLVPKRYVDDAISGVTGLQYNNPEANAIPSYNINTGNLINSSLKSGGRSVYLSDNFVTDFIGLGNSSGGNFTNFQQTIGIENFSELTNRQYGTVKSEVIVATTNEALITRSFIYEIKLYFVYNNVGTEGNPDYEITQLATPIIQKIGNGINTESIVIDQIASGLLRINITNMGNDNKQTEVTFRTLTVSGTPN